MNNTWNETHHKDIDDELLVLNQSFSYLCLL